jgi:hypothetical protein
MKRTGRRLWPIGIGLCVVVALVLMTVFLASCGGAKVKTQSKSSGTEKLPPGITQNQTEQSSATSSSQSSAQSQSATQSTTTSQQTAKTPSASADLAGGRFTIVNATRPDTNKSVISSSAREVKGDYLEVEFTIQNVGTDVIDLSQYSFRLQSPGVAADTYYNYYGNTGTYGKYVNENEISASLLDYANLQPVTYKVKVGELIDKVFAFFDLNPSNVARNAGVTKDNTTLVIRKVSGTDYGDEVKIPLTGYPD